MNEARTAVHTLGADDAADVVDVLRSAFSDYPVLRFVLGPASGDAELQSTLVRFFVMARVLRGETVLGIRDGSALVAAALVSRPDGGPHPPELRALRDQVWAELGAEARARYQAFGAATAPFAHDAPHLHLNMIGVRPERQGEGLGGRLLERVHERSAEDPSSTGVTLTTEDEANLPLYRRFGYEIVGEAVVAPELRTWGFFRPDPR